MTTDKPCSDHPDAPHGFDRNGSHMAGHYVCECSGWTPPASIQEELRSVPERSRTTLEAADRIDLDAARIDTLAKVVDRLQTERDEYRKCADDQAMKHKVERDELIADKEVLLGHMVTIRNCTNDPAIASLTSVVLERMAQKGEKV